MNETRTIGRKWSRHENKFGEVHYQESLGYFRIDKHIVDDREYDGGYVTTSYYLYHNDELVALPFYRVADAKQYVRDHY